MNHKTDMREALQLCIDAMLHDGVPTDPYHPRRVALAAAEAALASRPDAQADEREAIYQVSFSDDEGWLDTNKKVYDSHPEHARRVVYANAAAQPSQDEADLSERIIHAVEGECDGLAITEEQASNILAYLQYGAPMCDMPEAFHIVDNAIGAAEEYESEGGNLRIVTLRIDAARKVRAALASAPQAEAAQGVPDDVRAAVERMCSPLHESRLSGVTAQEDARCMKLIRDYVLGTDAASSPDREQVGEAEDIPPIMYNGETKRDPALRELLERQARRHILINPRGDAPPSRERGGQDCPHGVDDGACKQCYGEAVRGEQGALRGSCPDGRVCEIGCFGECEKRAAASTPTLGGGAAPWQGCKHRVCYKNGACWTAGKCLEPTEPEPWPTEIDAQIKACALMILGICATRPQDEWPKRIEGRIRYMLSRLQPQAAEPKGR